MPLEVFLNKKGEYELHQIICATRLKSKFTLIAALRLFTFEFTLTFTFVYQGEKYNRVDLVVGGT